LPVPLACPRPTRFFSFTPPPGGGVKRVSSFICFSPRVTPLARPSLAYTGTFETTSINRQARHARQELPLQKPERPWRASRAWRLILLLQLSLCRLCVGG